MGDSVDGNKPVDPDTEREVQDTMDKAVENMRDEETASLAKYMGNSYRAFRKQGFTPKQAFTLTAVLFQSLLPRG